MKQVDYLIVGGSAAGTTAAEVIRTTRKEASVTIISDENHEEYSRVLLPHYSRNQIKREQVFLKTPEWYSQKNIVFLKGARGQHLEVSKHKLSASNGEIYQYKKLLVAIGGETIRLDVPGERLENILYFKTLEDTDKILKAVKGVRSAVIIGGGLISVDLASCFKANNVDQVTILVLEPYYWSNKIDHDSSKILVNVFEKNGVSVLTEEEVDHFEPNGQGNNVGAVVTKSGKRFICDIVGVGIGIKPNMGWVAVAGIKTDRGILTNEYLETNVADVYAAGDCAQFKDVVFDRQHMMGNWANATTQGQAAAKGMVGERTVYETASSYSDSFFDGTYSFIGVTDSAFADEVIARGSVASGKMTQIYVKTINNVMRIVGATVINSAGEVSPLTAAVKGKADIAVHKDKLSDPNFNLSEINS